MKKRNMSKKEQIVLKRAKELDYNTDRLGPGSLLTQQSHTNSSRLIMVNHNLPHAVSIKDPELPLVPSGFEDSLAEFSSMLDKTDGDYEIVAKFEKNPYNYLLIGFDKKRKLYHAWKRTELEEHSEGFASRYNNQYIDSLEVGDVVPEGTYIKKSDSFDKYMNYRYGKNLNTVYLVTTKVYEDGILLMNNANRMMDTFRCHTITIPLSDNEVLLNWYGDDNHYQGIPNIGQKTKHGYVGVVRQLDGSKAPYALKAKRLQSIERGDRKVIGNGRVIDIDILYNKERAKLNDSPANKMIADMYDQQQEYYKRVYKFMRNIVDRADDDGYRYTDDFSIICEEAHDYVDSSAFFADSNDNVFGNMQITVTLINEEPLLVGSKLVGRYGNKGVIARILPPEKSWHMEDGTPIHTVVAVLGIIGRLNQSQMNEHSINELSSTAIEVMKTLNDVNKKGMVVYSLMKYLNSDEADSFKKFFKKLSDKEKERFCKRIERDGIVIIQDPIDNANITDIERAYEDFPAKWQRIVFEDGSKSMKKVLCAKMFFVRLKQDPVEKYSARSRGPVNPLTMLPEKSSRKKRNLDAVSDVAVRLGELEQEVLLTMVNHPAVVADFMTENSTSMEAKMAMSEEKYLGDLTTDEIDFSDVEEADIPLGMTIDEYFATIVENDYVVATGKKNMEQIEAYMNVLGTEINIETETAPDGGYFED